MVARSTAVATLLQGRRWLNYVQNVKLNVPLCFTLWGPYGGISVLVSFS